MSLSNPRRSAPVACAATSVKAAGKLSTSLNKGATFHSPATSTTTTLHTFMPPRLPRSQSHLDDVVDANRRRIAMTLTDIDEALSLEKLTISPKNEKKDVFRDTSLPVPRGFLDLPVVDPGAAKKEQRRVLRPRSVRCHHASDSGIGSSLGSCSSQNKADAKDASVTKSKKHGVIARSASSAADAETLPSLGSRAVNRIHEHTLGPLLEKPELKDFQSIVLDVPRRIRSKEIICLRDLEKTLLFMAPEKAKTGVLYLDFCLTSIRCIQATVEYLSDREQVRPSDRPYTNGYFVDLKEQILQYGRELAASKGDDSLDIDQGEEIKLYGGIAETGRPAELVRIKKDGSAISMATGKPVDMGEGPVQFKRTLSEQREDDEEIMRSMARRKKNASPEELAPKRCREAGCLKEFKRPCDLTKHEKTHSRPWKCPIPTCKYNEFGWPTEKEMDRHVNDKHSDKPAMYECQFTPCPYKSKRESNCKQHMEKAHGWTYVRTKTNGGKKFGHAKTPSSAQQTPPLANASTPSDAYSVPTPPQQDSHGPQAMVNDFPLYQSDADWIATYGMQPENLEGVDLSMEHLSPSSAASYEQYPPYQNGSQFITDEDIYAATARIPVTRLPQDESMLYNKMMPNHHHQLHHYQQPQPQTPLPQHQQRRQQPPTSVQAYHASQHYQVQAPAPHFSPNAQQNTMLYTPVNQVDDGYEETFNGVDGGDFQLFPANMGKGSNVGPLFGEVPSADLGFSQTSQPEIFQQVDLSQLDYQQFQE